MIYVFKNIEECCRGYYMNNCIKNKAIYTAFKWIVRYQLGYDW